jgi:hypothetical protein
MSLPSVELIGTLALQVTTAKEKRRSLIPSGALSLASERLAPRRATSSEHAEQDRSDEYERGNDCHRVDPLGEVQLRHSRAVATGGESRERERPGKRERWCVAAQSAASGSQAMDIIRLGMRRYNALLKISAGLR